MIKLNTIKISNTSSNRISYGCPCSTNNGYCINFCRKIIENKLPCVVCPSYQIVLLCLGMKKLIEDNPSININIHKSLILTISDDINNKHLNWFQKFIRKIFT